MSWLSVSLIQFTHTHTRNAPTKINELKMRSWWRKNTLCAIKTRQSRNGKQSENGVSLLIGIRATHEHRQKKALIKQQHDFSFQKTIASRSHSILWLVWEQMPIDGRANVHHIGISFMIYAWSDYDRRCFHSHKLTDNIKIIICNWFQWKNTSPSLYKLEHDRRSNSWQSQ